MKHSTRKSSVSRGTMSINAVHLKKKRSGGKNTGQVDGSTSTNFPVKRLENEILPFVDIRCQ